MKMHAMLMKNSHEKLIYTQIEKPTPSAYHILIKVNTCGIARTALYVVDGELKYPKLSLVPGHQIVGVIEDLGEEVQFFTVGSELAFPG